MQGRFVSNFHLFIVAFFSVVILVSCGGGGSSDLPKTDTTKPTVTLTPKTPLAGQRVTVTTRITAKFSKAMDKLSVETGFIVTPNNGGTIEYYDSIKTAIYKPSTGTDLLGDTKYTISLLNTIKDSFGNFLVEKSWSFTTEDNVKPTVIRTIPDSVAQPISTSNAIRIEFSEPMDLASFKKDFNGTSRNFEIKTGAIIVTGAGVDANGFLGGLTQTDRMVEYKPASSFIPDAIYTVTINTGVTDLNGNFLITQKTYSFKTIVFSDTAQPQFEVIKPVNNSKNNTLNSVIEVKFSSVDGTPEVMDWNSINSSNFIVKDGLGKQILGNFSQDLTTNVLTFTPLKNLNSLDTYSITLKDTITDKAGLNLVTNNTVASTFSTADGVLDSSPTPIGKGFRSSPFVTAFLSPKKDGSVYLIWKKMNPDRTKQLIMSKTYQLKTGWDVNPTDITSKIELPGLSTPSSFEGVITDSNDSHMLIWHNRSTSSKMASVWSKAADGTGTWKAPTQISSGVSFVQAILPHRSVNGTVSIGFYRGGKVFLQQLKSNNGSFGTKWSTETRITNSTPPTNVISSENDAVLSSDSLGNVVVLYEESLTSTIGLPTTLRSNVAKYPFPTTTTNIYQLDPVLGSSGGLVSDSSGDYSIFGWRTEFTLGRRDAMVSIYQPSQDMAPSSPYSTDANQQFNGVAVFPSGEGLAVTINNSGKYLSYSKYDPSLGMWSRQVLETIPVVDAFELYHGPRDIVTIVWVANLKLYVKRYKPGAMFGWQKTQSINVQANTTIDITSDLKGRATIMLNSYVVSTAVSDIFAIRLE